MKKIGVYKIVNAITADVYVGSSKNIINRWKHHIWQLNNNKHPNTHLQSAWNKYGKDNFIFSILTECEDRKDIIVYHEQYYIDLYKPFYNKCPIAGSCKGRVMSEEHKRKISEANKGKKRTDEMKREMSEIKSNMSDITKQKISKALKGKKQSDEAKRKNSEAHAGENNPFYGKVHSDEIKKIISDANKGNKNALGYKHTEEAKEKMRAAKKSTSARKGMVG